MTKFIKVCGEYINFDDVRSYTFTASELKILFRDGTSRTVQITSPAFTEIDLEFKLSELIPAEQGFCTIIHIPGGTIRKTPVIAWRRTFGNTIVPVTVLGLCQEDYHAIADPSGQIYECGLNGNMSLAEWVRYQSSD